MIHRQHHHYQKWVKIGICKTAPNLIIISLYQYHCFHHLIRWEYCYHPFTEIVWVSAVAPESYFTDRIFHLKIRSLSHSCQPYPHIFPTPILSSYYPHSYLILGALTNESFLLQVGLVLNKKSHQPNCPGADLKIHRFWNLATVKVWQTSKWKKDNFTGSFKKWWLHPRDCIVVWWSCYLKGCQWQLEVTLTLQHQRDGQYPHVAQSLDTSF